MNTLTAAIMGLTAAIVAATLAHHRRAWTHRIQQDLHLQPLLQLQQSGGAAIWNFRFHDGDRSDRNHGAS